MQESSAFFICVRSSRGVFFYVQIKTATLKKVAAIHLEDVVLSARLKSCFINKVNRWWDQGHEED